MGSSIVISWQFLLRLARFNRVVLSALFFMTAAAALPARADDWPDPARWDGSYPFDGPNGADIYKLASIHAALSRLVGEQLYRQVILQWVVYSPIQVDDGVMLIEGCKPHACDTDQATILLRGRQISVCIYHVSVPTSSVFVPGPWPSERLWYLEGVDLPVIERDPYDDEGCSFPTVGEAREKLYNAQTMAQ